MSEFQDLEVPGGFILPAAKLKEQTLWAIANRHANAYMQRVSAPQGDVLTIIDLYTDLHPTMSVTNDAEYVVQLAFKTHGNIPIIYCDTEGNWDELRHNQGSFGCFRPLATRDRDEAIVKVLALHELDSEDHRKTN